MPARGARAFARAFGAEIAKLRRSRVLPAVLSVPAGFVLLKSAMFLLRGETGLGADRYSFEYLFSLGLFFWDRLLVPLLAVTIATWVVWIEDESGHWKVLLTQPVARAAVYLSKLVVACALVFALQSCWWLFHAVAGLGLKLHGSETIGPTALHALRNAAALTPVVAVQLLLPVVLRSPFAALGIGVVGNVASLVLAGTAINRWHPWGLAQVAGQAAAPAWAMGAALAMAGAAAWVGVARFARKDV